MRIIFPDPMTIACGASQGTTSATRGRRLWPLPSNQTTPSQKSISPVCLCNGRRCTAPPSICLLPCSYRNARIIPPTPLFISVDDVEVCEGLLVGFFPEVCRDQYPQDCQRRLRRCSRVFLLPRRGVANGRGGGGKFAHRWASGRKPPNGRSQ